ILETNAGGPRNAMVSRPAAEIRIAHTQASHSGAKKPRSVPLWDARARKRPTVGRSSTVPKAGRRRRSPSVAIRCKTPARTTATFWKLAPAAHETRWSVGRRPKYALHTRKRPTVGRRSPEASHYGTLGPESGPLWDAHRQPQKQAGGAARHPLP